MLHVDKTKKISKKRIQMFVNQMLTWGGATYLLNKETIYKRLLINLKQTTEITNSNISAFA